MIQSTRLVSLAQNIKCWPAVDYQLSSPGANYFKGPKNVKICYRRFQKVRGTGEMQKCSIDESAAQPLIMPSLYKCASSTNVVKNHTEDCPKYPQKYAISCLHLVRSDLIWNFKRYTYTFYRQGLWGDRLKFTMIMYIVQLVSIKDFWFLFSKQLKTGLFDLFTVQQKSSSCACKADCSFQSSLITCTERSSHLLLKLFALFIFTVVFRTSIDKNAN